MDASGEVLAWAKEPCSFWNRERKYANKCGLPQDVQHREP